MTALPDPTPNGASRPNPSAHDARQHDEEAILVGGDVPVAVWRLEDRDDSGPAGAPRIRLASRLARRLILVYTRRGDAVVDFSNDPQLEHASVHTARTYRSITDPSTVADLDTLVEPVSLVVLRWPPRHSSTPAGITDLFAACRLIMTADTCAIAAVSSAGPGGAGTRYAEYLDELMPAARAAGLIHVLQIVAVTGLGQGDEFLYYATPAEAEAARRDLSGSHDGQSYHVDLLVFTSDGRND